MTSFASEREITLLGGTYDGGAAFVVPNEVVKEVGGEKYTARTINRRVYFVHESIGNKAATEKYERVSRTKNATVDFDWFVKETEY